MTLIFFSYDAQRFCEDVISNVNRLKRRRKTPRQIRWHFYCKWAYSLKFKNIGPPNSQYRYPDAILNFIRELTPEDIKGEIREDAHKVTLKDFCQALDMPKKH